MVKHTQTSYRQIAGELLECVWPFCEIGAKRDKLRKPICKGTFFFFFDKKQQLNW